MRPQIMRSRVPKVGREAASRTFQPAATRTATKCRSPWKVKPSRLREQRPGAIQAGPKVARKQRAAFGRDKRPTRHAPGRRTPPGCASMDRMIDRATGTVRTTAGFEKPPRRQVLPQWTALRVQSTIEHQSILA